MAEIGYIALGICFFIFGYQYAVRRKREAVKWPQDPLTIPRYKDSMDHIKQAVWSDNIKRIAEYSLEEKDYKKFLRFYGKRIS